jgi:hypothetical protein
MRQWGLNFRHAEDGKGFLGRIHPSIARLPVAVAHIAARSGRATFVSSSGDIGHLSSCERLVRPFASMFLSVEPVHEDPLAHEIEAARDLHSRGVATGAWRIITLSIDRYTSIVHTIC